MSSENLVCREEIKMVRFILSISLVTIVNIENILDEAEVEFTNVTYVNPVRWLNSEISRNSMHYVLS